MSHLLIKKWIQNQKKKMILLFIMISQVLSSSLENSQEKFSPIFLPSSNEEFLDKEEEKKETIFEEISVKNLEKFIEQYGAFDLLLPVGKYFPKNRYIDIKNISEKQDKMIDIILDLIYTKIEEFLNLIKDKPMIVCTIFTTKPEVNVKPFEKQLLLIKTYLDYSDELNEIAEKMNGFVFNCRCSNYV